MNLNQKLTQEQLAKRLQLHRAKLKSLLDSSHSDIQFDSLYRVVYLAFKNKLQHKINDHLEQQVSQMLLERLKPLQTCDQIQFVNQTQSTLSVIRKAIENYAPVFLYLDKHYYSQKKQPRAQAKMYAGLGRALDKLQFPGKLLDQLVILILQMCPLQLQDSSLLKIHSTFGRASPNFSQKFRGSLLKTLRLQLQKMNKEHWDKDHLGLIYQFFSNLKAKSALLFDQQLWQLPTLLESIDLTAHTDSLLPCLLQSFQFQSIMQLNRLHVNQPLFQSFKVSLVNHIVQLTKPNFNSLNIEALAVQFKKYLIQLPTRIIQSTSSLIIVLRTAVRTALQKQVQCRQIPFIVALVSKINKEMLAIPQSQNCGPDSTLRLQDLLLMIRIIQQKDLFQQYYRKALVNRICERGVLKDQFEALNFIKLQCGVLEGHKIQSILKETSTQGLVLAHSPLKVRLFSSTIWPFQVPEVLPQSFPHPDFMFYEQKFRLDFPAKNLLWLGNRGQGLVKTNFKAGVFKLLQLDAACLHILLKFQRSDEREEQSLVRIQGFEPAQLQKGLQNLQSAGILVRQKGTVNFNCNFQSSRVRIKVMSKDAKLASKDMQLDPQTLRAVELERKLLMESLIVKILKIKKTVHIDQLQSQTEKALYIKNGSKVSREHLQRVLNGLVDRTFARRQDNLVHYSV